MSTTFELPTVHDTKPYDWTCTDCREFHEHDGSGVRFVQFCEKHSSLARRLQVAEKTLATIQQLVERL